MYAVIEAGGKQHRVVEGETLKLEKIEAATGDSIEFDKVLLVGTGEDVKIGKPVVDGSKVTAEVVAHGRHKKVKIENLTAVSTIGRKLATASGSPK